MAVGWPVELWFDYSSNNSYFAFHLLRTICRRLGGVMELKPIYAGAMFKERGHNVKDHGTLKLNYLLRDHQRWTQRTGLPFVHPELGPTRDGVAGFPIKTSLAMRSTLAVARLAGRELAEAFVERVMAVYWERTEDISNPEVVAKCISEAGLDASTVLILANGSEMRSALEAQTAQGMAKGIFGVPSFVVGGKVFWGKDRLDFVEDMVRFGSVQPRPELCMMPCNAMVSEKALAKQPEIELLYLPLRARAEPLRMMLHFARIPFKDTLVSLEEWPKIKPSMPPGLGSEFPGRPKGNRALPVLRLGTGSVLPESRNIALWIARQAGSPLLPHDASLVSEAIALFDASQSLPLFWATACLARFPEEVAERVMRSESVVDVAGGGPQLQQWLEGQAGWADLRPALHRLESRLEKMCREQGSGPFFGGTAPHYGDFAIWVQVDNLVTLLGRASAFDGFGECWQKWYDAVADLDGVRQYLKSRPQRQGYPNSIMISHADPATRPAAGRRARL